MTTTNQMMMSLTRVPGLSDVDCQEDGKQELPRQEPGSGRDTRLYVDDLFRQDWHTDAEPHDGGSHVV